ncbi:MAG: type II toxin-antitoxin system HicB family antitoxin [Verrucomicrobia bacterium]|nr:type II toxin-antitoxin system HicB family antitoxin [Verrucomicrobiota bacterium]
MNTKLTMVDWKSKKFRLGKLLEYPEIMTQGRTLNELEENILDAYRMMISGSSAWRTDIPFSL